jgi:hypothetical protein
MLLASSALPIGWHHETYHEDRSLRAQFCKFLVKRRAGVADWWAGDQCTFLTAIGSTAKTIICRPASLIAFPFQAAKDQTALVSGGSARENNSFCLLLSIFHPYVA